VIETVEVVLSGAGTFPFASSHEWRSVCARHHSMLLEGPEEATETVLSLLKPHLRTPVVWTCSQSLREFPAAASGAVVLRDVAALCRPGQTRLFKWLDDPHGPKQVVSTSAHPLFPSVARGHFDEALYYRLNVIRLSVALKAMAPIPRSAIESSTGAVWNTDLR